MGLKESGVGSSLVSAILAKLALVGALTHTYDVTACHDTNFSETT